jgi:hypothetical protein
MKNECGTESENECPPGSVTGPKRRKGGQPGNSNARKGGMHTGEMRALRATVRVRKRSAKVVLAAALAVIAKLPARGALG